MKVVEIFKSIDGEGIRTGLPVTFIRLFGCNLRCSYCDTKYSYGDAPFKEMKVSEIVNTVEELGIHRITLTGGEPLIHEDAGFLLTALLTKGYEVNVETNGSVDLTPFIFLHGSTKLNLFYTMDYKSISSGMYLHNNENNLNLLTEKDVLKFVVGSLQDLDDMKQVLEKHDIKARVFVSPVFGQIEPRELVEYVLANNLNNVTVQVQLHKIIWDPEQRGV